MFHDEEKHQSIFKGIGVVLTVAVLIVSGVFVFILIKQDNNHNAVVFGEEQRTFQDAWGDVTAYSERESFSYYLIQEAQEQDCAMAEIAVGEEKADFEWTFGEDRDELVRRYIDAKEGFSVQKDAHLADYWIFLKIKTEDIYDLDIWNGVQEAWGGNLEANHEILASVNETGRVCEIREYNNGTATGKWSVYIKDDFLYILECMESQISDSEELKLPVRYFYYSGILENSSDYCAWGMDEELFYWRDHDKRVTKLENPDRTYTQTVGTDDRWAHFLGMTPCGILEKAEYAVSLSEEGPELKICFTLKEKASDCYLPDIGAADYQFAMEVSEAESGKVLQNGEASMCVDVLDTLRFEDLDKDGFLDMHIVHPDHAVASESNADDQFSYTYYWYDPPSYWIWDNDANLFVRMSEREISERLNKNLAGQQENDGMGIRDTVVVQEGDSLWKIAEKYLGDGRKYHILYDRNRAVIGDNPNFILPGVELELESAP